MKGHFKKATFVLAGVLAVGFLLWGMLRPAEPVYQGKRLSTWLRDLDSWPGKTSELATKAIREIGTNSLPYLVSALKSEDTGLKVMLSKLLGQQNLIRFRFRSADEVRDTACKALLILGSTASNAIPEIGRMFDQQPGSAGMALFAIGGISIPTLVEACHYTNPSVRAEAAFILCKLTPPGRRGGYSTTFYQSGSTIPVSRFLLTIGDDDMAALAANLNDPRPGVRRASAEALRRYWGIAKPAVPGLLKAFEDPDPDVRKAAAEALKAIDPDAASKANAK